MPDGAGFQVRSEWKELLVYAEGERSFVLDAGWGAKPVVAYVPDPASWEQVVPLGNDLG